MTIGKDRPKMMTTLAPSPRKRRTLRARRVNRRDGGRDAVLAMARNLQLTPNLRPENCRAPAKKALSRSRKSVRNSIELAEGLRSCASVDVEGNKKPLAHERPRIAPRPFR